MDIKEKFEKYHRSKIDGARVILTNILDNNNANILSTA